jgi:hypothetical protein
VHSAALQLRTQNADPRHQLDQLRRCSACSGIDLVVFIESAPNLIPVYKVTRQHERIQESSVSEVVPVWHQALKFSD